MIYYAQNLPCSSRVPITACLSPACNQTIILHFPDNESVEARYYQHKHSGVLYRRVLYARNQFEKNSPLLSALWSNYIYSSLANNVYIFGNDHFKSTILNLCILTSDDTPIIWRIDCEIDFSVKVNKEQPDSRTSGTDFKTWTQTASLAWIYVVIF